MEPAEYDWRPKKLILIGFFGTKLRSFCNAERLRASDSAQGYFFYGKLRLSSVSLHKVR